jgi:hypothetical protein
MVPPPRCLVAKLPENLEPSRVGGTFGRGGRRTRCLVGEDGALGSFALHGGLERLRAATIESDWTNGELKDEGALRSGEAGEAWCEAHGGRVPRRGVGRRLRGVCCVGGRPAAARQVD